MTVPSTRIVSSLGLATVHHRGLGARARHAEKERATRKDTSVGARREIWARKILVGWLSGRSVPISGTVPPQREAARTEPHPHQEPDHEAEQGGRRVVVTVVRGRGRGGGRRRWSRAGRG